ncbi:efflux RND transporter periplasmic adaptor subunit [Pararhodospirillum photometricum]|nr:efflux RND transporter periplasmic adaptor subunit [Pararhodospirillum photometricum]
MKTASAGRRDGLARSPHQPPLGWGLDWGLSLGLTLSLVLLPAGAHADDTASFVVRQETVADWKAVFATVETTDMLQARARIGGTVGSLALDEGDPVTKGQKIAVIADEKLLLQMQAAEARVRSLQAELEQATLELGRSRALRAQGTVAQQHLDEAATKARVTAQTLEAAKRDRDVIARQIEDGAVLSPGAGRVLAVSVTNGAVVLPGEPLASIAAETTILRLRLPERHARFLSKGASVRVGPRGLDVSAPRPTSEGTVVQVYPKLEAGRVIADVRVEGLGDYFVGERALVSVATDQRPVLRVPGRFLEHRFGLTLAHLAEGGPVVVQTGQRQGDWVEVLSGLHAGDTLTLPAAGARP